jgi:hypothetical protein
MFAWTYKGLKGNPLSLAKHCIELKKDVPHLHQAHYRMNPNYANIVKQDVDKLLKTGYFKHVEVTWLSAIAIVPKKNRKLQIWIYYRIFSSTTKNKIARQTWIAMVTAIIPTTQEANQKKSKLIRTKRQMYTRKRLKGKQKKCWM